MKLVVVVLNWNNAKLTAHCVSQLHKWRQLKPQIFVVDNCSKQPDVEYLLTHCRGVQVLRNEINGGFAGGNNLAFKTILSGTQPERTDATILLLNNDAMIEENQAMLLLRLLNDLPHVAIVGPVLVEETATATIISAGGRDISRSLNAHWNLTALPEEGVLFRQVDYVPGTIALLRQSVIEEIGDLDERYFFSGEIADWCERARRAGYKALIHLQAKGFHQLKQENDLRGTLYLYYSLRNRLLYTRKFAPTWRLIYWYAFYLKVALGHLYRHRPAAARATLLALWHGIIGRFGNQNTLFISSNSIAATKQ